MSSYHTGKHFRLRRHGPPRVETSVLRVVDRENHGPSSGATISYSVRDIPAEAAKEVPDAATMKEASQPPASEWSAWESIKDAQWDGYWRAKHVKHGTRSIDLRRGLNLLT